jgi:RNA polymerase sigma-70 factor, ECF subfamily
MDWMNESDGAIIAKAQAGDKDAFRVLVEQHSRAIFRLAYRITRNEQDAEDVVQESFLRAYKQLHRYESRATFATWIYRIASNYALDLIRARQRHGEEQMDTVDSHSEATYAVSAAAPAQDRLVYSREVERRVRAVMSTLTPQERLAFTLRHLEGQSIEEIAAVLGTAANATKNSIFRAVQKLRRGLEPVVSSVQ